MKYVKGFDTIRALAVFFVIVDHWGPVLEGHTIGAFLRNSFIPDGQFGVNLFFVLSGFLITSILLNEKMKNAEGKHFTIIKNFFARRILRIFPIYYLVIILCCLFNYQFVIDHIGYYLTYTSNLIAYRTNMPNVLSHTWSLAVEEQFYLIWPWLIILINKKYLPHVLALSVLIGIVSKYVVVYTLHHRFPILVINWFDSFGIGGLYAYIRLDKERCRKFEKAFRIIFPLMLFIALRIVPYGGLPICVIYYRTLDSIIAIAMIMFAINNDNEWVRKYIMENRVLNFIGRISYGIYLYHFTFGYSYDAFIHDFAQSHPRVPAVFTGYWFSYGVKLTLLLTICWLSFKFIEQPILRLKKRFEYGA